MLCHLASSRPSREQFDRHWSEFSPTGDRGQTLSQTLKPFAPCARILPPLPQLDLYLAVLARAKFFIADDTGSLHFAAGLGVPTVALFGPSDPVRFAPRGARRVFVLASECACGPGVKPSLRPEDCLDTITAGQVLAALQKLPVND